jgi:hypothetical protein
MRLIARPSREPTEQRVSGALRELEQSMETWRREIAVARGRLADEQWEYDRRIRDAEAATRRAEKDKGVHIGGDVTLLRDQIRIGWTMHPLAGVYAEVGSSGNVYATQGG